MRAHTHTHIRENNIHFNRFWVENSFNRIHSTKMLYNIVVQCGNNYIVFSWILLWSYFFGLLIEFIKRKSLLLLVVVVVCMQPKITATWGPKNKLLKTIRSEEATTNKKNGIPLQEFFTYTCATKAYDPIESTNNMAIQFLALFQ